MPRGYLALESQGRVRLPVEDGPSRVHGAAGRRERRRRPARLAGAALPGNEETSPPSPGIQPSVSRVFCLARREQREALSRSSRVPRQHPRAHTPPVDTLTHAPRPTAAMRNNVLRGTRARAAHTHADARQQTTTPTTPTTTRIERQSNKAATDERNGAPNGNGSPFGLRGRHGGTRDGHIVAGSGSGAHRVTHWQSVYPVGDDGARGELVRVRCARGRRDTGPGPRARRPGLGGGGHGMRASPATGHPLGRETQTISKYSLSLALDRALVPLTLPTTLPSPSLTLQHKLVKRNRCVRFVCS